MQIFFDIKFLMRHLCFYDDFFTGFWHKNLLLHVCDVNDLKPAADYKMETLFSHRQPCYVTYCNPPAGNTVCRMLRRHGNVCLFVGSNLIIAAPTYR